MRLSSLLLASHIGSNCLWLFITLIILSLSRNLLSCGQESCLQQWSLWLKLFNWSQSSSGSIYCISTIGSISCLSTTGTISSVGSLSTISSISDVGSLSTISSISSVGSIRTIGSISSILGTNTISCSIWDPRTDAHSYPHVDSINLSGIVEFTFHWNIFV